MNIATLKVHGDVEGLADLRDGLPTEPDSTWDKGDVRPDGRIRIDSGFYVGVATDKNPDVLLKKIRTYLAECQSRGIHFERVAITDKETGAPTLDFSLTDLKMLVAMGISLSICS